VTSNSEGHARSSSKEGKRLEALCHPPRPRTGRAPCPVTARRAVCSVVLEWPSHVQSPSDQGAHSWSHTSCICTHTSGEGPRRYCICTWVSAPLVALVAWRPFFARSPLHPPRSSGHMHERSKRSVVSTVEREHSMRQPPRSVRSCVALRGMPQCETSYLVLGESHRGATQCIRLTQTPATDCM